MIEVRITKLEADPYPGQDFYGWEIRGAMSLDAEDSCFPFDTPEAAARAFLDHCRKLGAPTMDVHHWPEVDGGLGEAITPRFIFIRPDGEVMEG